MADYIERFVDMMDTGMCPRRYLTWAAVHTIATTIDRQAWTTLVGGRPLFPNLYILLVGAPAAGKSFAIDPARDILQSQVQVESLPDSVTHEDFVRWLGNRCKQFEDPEVESYQFGDMARSSISLQLSEWGTFLRKPAPDTMSMIAAIYDCGDYRASTISRGLDRAKNCYINILAGVTPSWFAEGFPPNAYEQGLPTRIIFVWGEGIEPKDQPDYDFGRGYEGVTDPFAKLSAELASHLDQIAHVEGLIDFDDETVEAYKDWKNTNFKPEPQDPLLSGYKGRRNIMAAKLSHILAMSAHPKDPVIRLTDFERSRTMLLDVEKDMPLALGSAGGNIYQGRENTVYNYIVARFKQTKRPVPEWEIRQRLGKMVPANMLGVILEEMNSKQIIRALKGTEAPLRHFKPGVIKQ